MPLIPGVNQRSVNPDAANTPYFKIDTTGEEFGNGVAKSILGLGTALGNMADATDKIAAAKIQQEKDAKAQKDAAEQQAQSDALKHLTPQPRPEVSHAIDLTTRFNGSAQDLLSGYFQLSGKDAVDGLPDAMDGIDQAQSNVLAKASTPESGDLAQPAIATWAGAVKDHLQRHVVAQQKVYDDDLDTTQVAQGRQAVGLLYNDDRTFLMNLHVAARASADQAARSLGSTNPQAGPEQIAAVTSAAQQTTASDFTRARIEAAMGQGDLATAQALHDRWGGDLLPADLDAVTQHLTATQQQTNSDQQTQRIMAVYQPTESDTQYRLT